MIYINANYIGFCQEFNLIMQLIQFYHYTNNNIQLTFVSDQMYKFGCTSKYRDLHNVALKVYMGYETAS